jgi:hypothetical protein
MSSPHTRYPEDPNPKKVADEATVGLQPLGCLFLLFALLLVCGTLLACVWIIWGGC